MAKVTKGKKIIRRARNGMQKNSEGPKAEESGISEAKRKKMRARRRAASGRGGSDTRTRPNRATTGRSSGVRGYPNLSEDVYLPPQEERFGAVAEPLLISHLERFKGFTYDLHDPRYPQPIPGVSLPQAPPRFTNCCCFVEALLVGAWADAQVEGFQWNRDFHDKMMIMDAADLFSPVTAAVESGMGEEVEDVNALPEPWTLVQGWSESYGNGHSFLILDVDPASGRILTLEANSAYGLNGVGYRHLGNIDDFSGMHPGIHWSDNGALWDWGRFRTAYPNMRTAKLDIADIGWIRGG